MGEAEGKWVRAPTEVIVSVSSSQSHIENLDSDEPSPDSCLETKKKSRLYNYLYGPYKQHQFLVDCVLELKKKNSCQGEDVPGRMLRVGPSRLGWAGDPLAICIWYLTILLPFVFILMGQLHQGTWMLCCCCLFVCLLISCHSITIFFILHNQKIAKRFWFINKVNLDHYCGRENKVVAVTLENTMTMDFLSAGQKSQVIARLARSQAKRGTMLMCTRSFWISRFQDPLLSVLFLLIVSLITLIVNVDLLRQNYL